MSKTKFTLRTILGIVVGLFIVGFLGLDTLLANVWRKILGEPNVVSRTITSIITILVCYCIIYRSYKRSVK